VSTVRVGLTGNVASGKSAVAAVWAEAGVPVVNADTLAREVVAPGSPGLTEVVEAFGEEVLQADGSLDRARLRDLVFRDEEARTRLEAILHPRIARLREEWVRRREAEGAPLVVEEVPLLFEAGLQGEFRWVVLVDAPEAIRLQRLVALRSLPREEALRMMAAQMDPAEKRERADWVLENAGSLHQLREKALAMLEELRKRVASPP